MVLFEGDRAEQCLRGGLLHCKFCFFEAVTIAGIVVASVVNGGRIDGSAVVAGVVEGGSVERIVIVAGVIECVAVGVNIVIMPKM